MTIQIQMQVQSGKLGKSVTERERKREKYVKHAVNLLAYLHIHMYIITQALI